MFHCILRDGSDSWRASVTRVARSYIKKAERTRTDNDTVYCCTMPLGTVIVRYGNNVMFTGQCQNWPKKAEGYMKAIFGDDLPPTIRTIVVPPEPDWVMMEGDFCQAELFVLAALSEDANMLKALRTPGQDLHDMTAISAFGLTVIDPDGNEVPDELMVAIATKYGVESHEFKSLQKTLRYVDQRGDIMTRGAFKAGIRISAKNLFQLDTHCGSDNIAA